MKKRLGEIKYKLVTDYNDYVDLLWKIGSINKNILQRLILDFEDIVFIRPVDIVILGCLFEELNDSNVETEIINENDSIKKFLESIKFYNYWNDGFNRNNYTEVNNNSSLCLWHISKEMIDQYIDSAKRYYERLIVRKNIDLDPFHICLVELFNNVFDHSESISGGFVFTQYYKDSNKIAIAVCDFGKGIAKSINEYRIQKDEDILSDDEAIEQALEYGYTSHSKDHNMGFGLGNIIDNVKGLNGDISIVSNKGFYHCYYDSSQTKCLDNTYLLEKEFKGCVIMITLDISLFEEKEDQVEDVFEI